MKAATVADFDAAIRTLETEDLRLFMRKMIELCAQKQNYVGSFGSAMDRFVEACRNISEDPRPGRLGKLVELLFNDAKLDLHAWKGS